MRCASAVALACVLAAPAQAQYQPWPYYPAWPQVEQPKQQQRLRPERRRVKAKPSIVYRTRTVTVVKRDTWRGMSQDRAREWLRDQAEEFCRKFPSDMACQRPAQ
jgi:hypothetical protein